MFKSDTNSQSKSKDNKGFYKRGRMWWFYYSKGGKQYCQSSKKTNLQDAIIFKNEFLKKLEKQLNNTNNNSPFEQIQRGYLLDFVIQKFFEEKDRTCSQKTIELYEILFNNILKFFNEKTIINNIKKIDIKNYENYRLLNGISEGWLLKELNLLNNIFNFAIDNEFLEINPFTTYRFKKIYKNYSPRTRYLTPEECQLLIQNANKYLKRQIIILLESGMRINEALNIMFSDIATEPKSKIQFLRIRKEITKSRKERYIPLSNLAMEQINQQKLEFPNSMFIFTDSTGKAYKGRPRGSLKTALNKSGLNEKGLGFHTLRHTFASHKLQGINFKGEPTKPVRIEILAEILGHEDINLTKKVYAKSSKNSLLEILNDF